MEFLALRCFQCSHWVVQQRTKNSKWSCRLCGAKQSITKVYGVSSSAKEVRALVQQLAMRAGLAQEAALLPQHDEGGADDYGLDYSGGLRCAPNGLSEAAAAVGSAWSDLVEPSMAVGVAEGDWNQAGERVGTSMGAHETDLTTVALVAPKRGRGAPAEAQAVIGAGQRYSAATSTAVKPTQGTAAIRGMPRSTQDGSSWWPCSSHRSIHASSKAASENDSTDYSFDLGAGRSKRSRSAKDYDQPTGTDRGILISSRVPLWHSAGTAEAHLQVPEIAIKKPAPAAATTWDEFL
jgi:hypothetical protein